MNLEQIVKLRFKLSDIKKPKVKEGFPIPSPEGEDEQTFISRCISKLIDEYGQEQAAAICYGQWEKK